MENLSLGSSRFIFRFRFRFRFGFGRRVVAPDLIVQAQTLVSEFAPLGAAFVQFGVAEDMSATAAAPPGFIFEEFHRRAAVGTGNFEYIAGAPEGHVLARTHGHSHYRSISAPGLVPARLITVK